MMIDNLLELVLILGFWQITKLISVALKITKLESFIPKVHVIFKFTFFFFVLCPLKQAQEISNQFSMLDKITICISSCYSYAFLIIKIIMILIPILFVFKMLGINFEDVFNAESPTRKGSLFQSKRREDNIIGGETNRWPHLRASNMHKRYR